jgi:hypothetical protein
MREHSTHRLQICATALVFGMTAGCASAPNREASTGPTPNETDAFAEQSAELIDCSAYPAPETDPGAEFVIVTVPIEVGADGAATGVGVPQAGRTHRSQDVLDRAVSLARSCMFEPATVNGHPVADRVDVQFRLSLNGLS